MATKKQSAPTAHVCLCGCGGEAKSRFLPGHDAKLKSRLINEALGHRTEKGRAAAEAEIKKLGWGAFLTKSRTAREAKAKA